MENYRQYRFGDMILCYFVDAEQRVSMKLVPEAMEGRVLEKEYRRSISPEWITGNNSG